jgi:hypothetical protein
MGWNQAADNLLGPSREGGGTEQKEITAATGHELYFATALFCCCC